MLARIFETMIHTPLWVWTLLLFVLYRGIIALKSRVVQLKKIFILPIIFFCIAVYGLIAKHEVYTWTLWVLFFAAGIGIGWYFFRKTLIKADKKHGLIHLPGTTSTLIMIIIFFGIQYYFGYTKAVNPELAKNVVFIGAKLLSSGLVSGIFVGKALRMLHRFKHAEHTDLMTEINKYL